MGEAGDGRRRTPDWAAGRRLRAWRPMPCVLWPWLCQLLSFDEHDDGIDIGILALEEGRVAATRIGPGTFFTIRVDPIPNHDAHLDVIDHWAQHGEVVILMCGPDGRQSWACFGRGHSRFVLTGLVTDLGAGHHGPCTRPATRQPMRWPGDLGPIRRGRSEAA